MAAYEYLIKKLLHETTESCVNKTEHPADSEQIQECERLLRRKIHPAYKEFLLLYNGAEFFTSCDIVGIRFLSTQELFAAEKELSESYGEDWIMDLLPIYKTIGAPHYMLINSNGVIFDGDLYDSPSKWIEIPDNFETFVVKSLETGGSLYWLDEELPKDRIHMLTTWTKGIFKAFRKFISPDSKN